VWWWVGWCGHPDLNPHGRSVRFSSSSSRTTRPTHTHKNTKRRQTYGSNYDGRTTRTTHTKTIPTDGSNLDGCTKRPTTTYTTCTHTTCAHTSFTDTRQHDPAVVPEYPLDPPLLATFMIIVYGLIRRKRNPNIRQAHL
jgi:hypothetical protein